MSYPASYSALVQQLITCAKEISEKVNAYRRLHHEHEELSSSLTPSPWRRKRDKKSKAEIKHDKETLEVTEKALLQLRQEIMDHPFRKLLHKQFAYKSAFDCYKKKIFNFREEITGIGVNNQMIFELV